MQSVKHNLKLNCGDSIIKRLKFDEHYCSKTLWDNKKQNKKMEWKKIAIKRPNELVVLSEKSTSIEGSNEMKHFPSFQHFASFQMLLWLPKVIRRE